MCSHCGDSGQAEEIEHGDDGKRWHESASYEGYVYACLCGERFMDTSELGAHIAEFAPAPKCEHRRLRWDVSRGEFFCAICGESLGVIAEIEEALRDPQTVHELAGAADTPHTPTPAHAAPFSSIGKALLAILFLTFAC